ncbi:MAG: hypothetical protein ACK2UJ_22250 [Candidatus Promineifilaceae bacterium]
MALRIIVVIFPGFVPLDSAVNSVEKQSAGSQHAPGFQQRIGRLVLSSTQGRGYILIHGAYDL